MMRRKEQHPKRKEVMKSGRKWTIKITFDEQDSPEFLKIEVKASDKESNGFEQRRIRDAEGFRALIVFLVEYRLWGLRGATDTFVMSDVSGPAKLLSSGHRGQPMWSKDLFGCSGLDEILEFPNPTSKMTHVFPCVDNLSPDGIHIFWPRNREIKDPSLLQQLAYHLRSKERWIETDKDRYSKPNSEEPKKSKTLEAAFSKLIVGYLATFKTCVYIKILRDNPKIIEVLATHFADRITNYLVALETCLNDDPISYYLKKTEAMKSVLTNSFTRYSRRFQTQLSDDPISYYLKKTEAMKSASSNPIVFYSLGSNTSEDNNSISEGLKKAEAMETALSNLVTNYLAGSESSPNCKSTSDHLKKSEALETDLLNLIANYFTGSKTSLNDNSTIGEPQKSEAFKIYFLNQFERYLGLSVILNREKPLQIDLSNLMFWQRQNQTSLYDYLNIECS